MLNLLLPLAMLATTSRRIVKRGWTIAFANRNAVYYAIGFISVFALTYWLMGLEKHFDVPEYVDKKHKNSFFNSLYTSTMAQSNAMPDLTPKTNLARALFMIQVCTGWMWFLVFSDKS